jgi:hypothetical protein
MSGMNTGQTAVEGESERVHLVYTGHYNVDRVRRLFILYSGRCTMNHRCFVFTCDNTSNEVLSSINLQESADHIDTEHGWFDDVALFSQICCSHPVPDGQGSENVFTIWRDGVLAFIDANHSQPLWLRIN